MNVPVQSLCGILENMFIFNTSTHGENITVKVNNIIDAHTFDTLMEVLISATEKP